jgi:hypothetical protein
MGCGENINPQPVDRLGKLIPMNDDEKELLKVGAETAMKPTFPELAPRRSGNSRRDNVWIAAQLRRRTLLRGGYFLGINKGGDGYKFGLLARP